MVHRSSTRSLRCVERVISYYYHNKPMCQIQGMYWYCGGLRRSAPSGRCVAKCGLDGGLRPRSISFSSRMADAGSGAARSRLLKLMVIHESRKGHGDRLHHMDGLFNEPIFEMSVFRRAESASGSVGEDPMPSQTIHIGDFNRELRAGL